MSVKEYFLKIDYYLDSKMFFDILKIGLFDFLDTKTNSAELSKQLSIDANLLDKILRIAYEKGWVLKIDNNYINTEDINKFFNRNSKEYIGDIFLSKLSKLDYHIDDLKAIPHLNKNENLYEKEVNLLRLNKFSNEIKNLKINKALDLGCGSNIFALEILKLFPNSSVVLFDKKKIIDNLKNQNQDENIIYKSGIFLTDSIGNAYDLIIASGILDFAYKDLNSFFEKMVNTLNPNGYIFLYSISLDENKIINPTLRWLSGDISSNIIPVSKKDILEIIDKQRLDIVKITEDEIYPLWILKKGE